MVLPSFSSNASSTTSLSHFFKLILAQGSNLRSGLDFVLRFLTDGFRHPTLTNLSKLEQPLKPSTCSSPTPPPKPSKSCSLPLKNQSFSFLCQLQNPPYTHIQKCHYVDVYMKWKKDSYYDSIEHIHRSIELKPIVSLKNCIAQDPNGCIPISEVSKRGLELGVPMKVARFLRQYPAIFEEFTGPQYNLPWFRLTPEAAEIDREEKRVFEERRDDLKYRLKRFILMSKGKVLPLKIIQGMQWYLGLPVDFLRYLEVNHDESFRLVEIEDGLKGLAVEGEEKVLSVVQRNAMKRGAYFGGTMEAIEFSLFPSKGLRVRRKIEDWLKEFQKLPYVSPYEDFSHLDPDSEIAEKRVVGFLHELLSLFVDHSAERKKLLCLKKYFGLPQKVHKAFERHLHMFYLSLRNKTCTAILKEAYNDKSAIEKHPLLKVRKKYIRLMKESELILKKRRFSNRFVNRENMKLDLDLDAADEERREMPDCSL